MSILVPREVHYRHMSLARFRRGEGRLDIGSMVVCVALSTNYLQHDIIVMETGVALSKSLWVSCV